MYVARQPIHQVSVTSGLRELLAAIDRSPLLRDELIAQGLSPSGIADGLREHVKHIEGRVTHERS
jgi:hypothetical protein